MTLIYGYLYRCKETTIKTVCHLRALFIIVAWLALASKFFNSLLFLFRTILSPKVLKSTEWLQPQPRLRPQRESGLKQA